MKPKKNTKFTRALQDGFLLVLPLGITIGIIYWLWSFVRKFIPDMSYLVPLSWREFPYFNSIVDLGFLLLVFLLIIISGFLGSTFLGKWFNNLIDKFLMSPTVIRPVYATVKKLAELFFKNEDHDINVNLSESVLVPYPTADSKTIGFVTSDNANHFFGEEDGPNWLTVYLPSSPIISSGFYLTCRKSDVEPCLISSAQALTTVLSAGSIQQDIAPTSLSIQKPVKKNHLQLLFFQGLLFLTPIIGTISIFTWVFNSLYRFIRSFTVLLPVSLQHFIPASYYNAITSILILIIMLLSMALIGFLAESAFGLWIKSLSNRLFNSIPMFNAVYSSVAKIVQAFSSDPSKEMRFNKAVLLPFPNPKALAIGFVTANNSSAIMKNGQEYIPVFVPTTPIPTTGWFVSVPREQVKFLDMPIEKAFGLVISGGILSSEKDSK